METMDPRIENFVARPYSTKIYGADDTRNQLVPLIVEQMKAELPGSFELAQKMQAGASLKELAMLTKAMEITEQSASFRNQVLGILNGTLQHL